MRWIGASLSILSLTLAACGPPTPPTAKIGCWTQEVTNFSSEGSSTDYSAADLLGPADVLPDWSAPYCSDSPLAWSPLTRNGGNETLTVKFERPISVDRVRIFENFGPGVTQLVTLFNTLDESVPILQFAVPGELQGPGQACGILNVDVDMADGFEFSRDTYDLVTIDFDTTQVTGWNEIDAIQLAGQVSGSFDSAPASCDAYEFVEASPSPSPSPSPSTSPSPTPTP